MPNGLEIVVAGDTIIAASEHMEHGWEVTVRPVGGWHEPQVIGWWVCSASAVRERLGGLATWHVDKR